MFFWMGRSLLRGPMNTVIKILQDLFNPLYSGNPLTGTFANSENPDEMQHDAAFHQGLHCL